MKKFFMVTLLFGIVVMLMGCPPKKVAKPEIEQPPTTSEEVVQKTADVKHGEKITEPEHAKIETKEAELPKHVEEGSVFEDIHFDFDRYDIRLDAKPTLKTVADWMLKNPATKILIEGHCCEMGTNEYNLALGDRRAKATRDYLVALGVASGRIEMISYGEEMPFCTESKAEECLKINRRAHFVVTK
ncbi:MAG: OmpA family protein [Nitrospirota bacterium]